MSVDSLVIRHARPDDDAAIGELLVDAFVVNYARKMPEVVVTDERKADLRNVAEKRRIAAVIVAERSNLGESSRRIVGSVTLYPPGAPRSEAWLPNTADLRTLGIALDEKGGEVAARLLDETEKVARQWNCDAISLHVRRGAYGVARLYEKRGYRREPSGDIDRLPSIFLEAYLLRLK